MRAGWLLVLLSGCGPDECATCAMVDAQQPADLAPPGPPLTTAARVFVEPQAGAKPVLDAIQGARTSISVEVYFLTDGSVINALIAAQKAGRKVRVILEKAPTGGSNASVYSQLSAGGVLVQYGNPAFTFTHTKMMIVDGAELWAMTMNLTVSGSSANREYLLVDADPRDVAEAQAVFDADWAKATPQVDRLVVAPLNGRAKLGQLVASARSEIDVEWEALSDNEMGSRLAQALKAGARVKIVAPNNLAGTATESMLRALKGNGAEIRTLGTPYIHAKMILVDRERGFIGSENATSNSLDNNREVGVLWMNAEVAKQVGATFDADYSAGQVFF